MKKAIISLILIVLIAGKESQKSDKELKEKEVLGEKVPLKKGVYGTTFILDGGIDTPLDFFVNKLCEKIYYELTTNNLVDTINENGKGRWISYVDEYIVVSGYYHETKWHSATCDGGTLGDGQIRETAEPGKYAWATCQAGIAGRKTHWNVIE